MSRMEDPIPIDENDRGCQVRVGVTLLLDQGLDGFDFPKGQKCWNIRYCQLKVGIFLIDNGHGWVLENDVDGDGFVNVG